MGAGAMPSGHIASSAPPGCAMLFKRFGGQLMITLHAPNSSPLARQRIFEVEVLGDTLP
jgi:hypothetical protein